MATLDLEDHVRHDSFKELGTAEGKRFYSSPCVPLTGVFPNALSLDNSWPRPKPLRSTMLVVLANATASRPCWEDLNYRGRSKLDLPGSIADGVVRRPDIVSYE